MRQNLPALLVPPFLLMLDYTPLGLDARFESAPIFADLGEIIDALDLAPTACNALAVGWSLARGEFDGLRVEMPVRMSCMEHAWL